MFRAALRLISKTQLPELEWRGTRRHHVKMLQEIGLPYTVPYLYLPKRKSNIRFAEVSRFSHLLEFEGKPGNQIIDQAPFAKNKEKNALEFKTQINERPVKLKWNDDKKYHKYIDFVLSDLSKCKDCHLECCSVCRNCGVVHSEAQCGNLLMQDVVDKFKTWRRHFRSTKDHEEAIHNSYYRWIASRINGGKCPCNVVYKSYSLGGRKKESLDYVFATNCLKKYDKRTLQRHVEMIKETRNKYT